MWETDANDLYYSPCLKWPSTLWVRKIQKYSAKLYNFFWNFIPIFSKNIPSLCQNKTCVPQTLSQSRILVFTQYDTKELVYIFSKKNRDIVAEDYTLWYFLQPFYILMCFVYFIIHIYSTYLFIVSYLLTVIVCVGKSYFC